MNLETELENIIREESNKLILRYHAYHNNLHHEHKRNEKRFGEKLKKIVEKPIYWSQNRLFNPFYTRRKAKAIAKAIAKKIKNQTYTPNKPYIKEIPKNSGGTRKVTIYQIHDASVSKLFYKSLLHKNKHRFSSFSYAYRNDRNVHFAIQDIWIDISENSRTFIAEFDFSKFFDSISHDYLKKQYNKNGFVISDEEKFIIDKFLDVDNNDIGIPQGTSISLFLANLVCWNLDKNLEKEGLKFARYADDTIIWSLDYEKICNAFTIITDFSTQAGVKINAKKSDGISLLTSKDFPAELSNTKDHIEFLGYSISVDKVSIKDNSKKRIQKQISYLLYKNLIKPLKSNPLKNIIIPNRDKDVGLLTVIMQIRRYLYGGLSDRYLLSYIQGKTKRINFKGVMSFYPLVNNEIQLKELDGWLLSTFYRVLKLRAKLLFKHGHNVSSFFPFDSKNKYDLLEKCKKQKVYNKRLLIIPSFILIYKALQKGILEYGIEKTMNPESHKYNYENK